MKRQRSSGRNTAGGRYSERGCSTVLIAGTLASGLVLALAGCPAAQIETAQSYQDKIASGCKLAVAVTAFVPALSVYAVAACSTEAAIAKLALDPSSHAWLLKLVEQAKAAI